MNAVPGHRPRIVQGPERWLLTAEPGQERQADVVGKREMPVGQVRPAEAGSQREAQGNRGQQALETGHALRGEESQLGVRTPASVTVDRRVLAALVED